MERLKKLRTLFDEGFITKVEYDARRLQILEGSQANSVGADDRPSQTKVAVAERPPPPSNVPAIKPAAIASMSSPPEPEKTAGLSFVQLFFFSFFSEFF